MDGIPLRTMAFTDRHLNGAGITLDGEPVIEGDGRLSPPMLVAEMVANASDETLDLLADRLWHRIQDRMLATRYQRHTDWPHA